jgi:hypothetical protein
MPDELCDALDRDGKVLTTSNSETSRLKTTTGDLNEAEVSRGNVF